MALPLKKIYRPYLFHSCSQNHIFRCIFCFSTSITRRRTLEPHSVAEYLMGTLGFSSDKAATASKHLSPLRFPANPDSVLKFLRSYGFEDSQIKKLVSWHPKWLSSDVERTLRPKFEAFQGLGFSGSNLRQLVLSNPIISHQSLENSVRPRIEFWRDFLGSVENATKLFKAKPWLLGYALEQRVLPNLSLMREFGIPDNRTSMVVLKFPSFLLQKPESLKALADRVEVMGIPHDSGMFLWGLSTLRMVSKARFYAKVELMKSLGWSEVDFLFAFQTNPIFLTVSEAKLREKMDFFVKIAGCKPSELVQKPTLLMYSLEKRLLPRYHAVQILKLKGLYNGKSRVWSIMCRSEKRFMEDFILCHRDKVPHLHDWYIAACKRAVPLNSGLEAEDK